MIMFLYGSNLTELKFAILASRIVSPESLNNAVSIGPLVKDDVLSMILLSEIAADLVFAKSSIYIERPYNITATSSDQSSSGIYQQGGKVHLVLLVLIDIVSLPITHNICLK